ncbi:Spermatogenesis-associated protein 7 like protein [Dufourea novaeangliae]|uniref:Spermatogenesis-associated protein 7 like protein n=2 Tax=Dufourea novaeangliae TaxID=178035 RepID=A0A154P3P5_DUFNO|nr:Spermatogenesis-associated protein 7 like protein [Dufourea novaeangliae]
MSSHLRRVLLAKSAIDARNKNYTSKGKQFCKQVNCKPRFTKTGIRNDVINRLAYDTLHHPVDVLRMIYDPRYLYHCEDQQYFPDCYDYDVICSQSKLHNDIISARSSAFKVNKIETFTSNDGEINQQTTNTTFKHQDMSQHRYEKDSMLYKTVSDFQMQEIDRSSMAVNSPRRNESFEIDQVSTDVTCNQKSHVKEDEAKYINFVYEITREILHSGLYTDEQLRDVFKKHLERNKEFLNMNKMMYEIYQLKLALNMSEDSDDEEFDDLVLNQRLYNHEKPRPPTPPKNLNENEVVDKLKSIQTGKRRCRHSSIKSVVLVDANPELVLTERDVLTSLIESNIGPVQAQQIYKKLSIKSKDIIHTTSIPSRTKRSSDDDITNSANNTPQPSLTEYIDSHNVEERE